MEKSKQQTLAELYTIRAGLSIISMEKDKLVKSEKSVEKRQNELNSTSDNIEIEKENLGKEEKNLISCQQQKASIVKKEFKDHSVENAGAGAAIGGGVGFLLSFIVSFIYQVVLEKDGNKFVVYLISLLIFVVIGTIIGFISGFPANKKEQKRVDSDYLAQIKESEANIISSNKKISEHQKKIETLSETKQTKETSYSKQLAIYNDVKTIVLSTSDILYNSLVKQFNSTLDCRDWKNIDLIIFYYETGRADTLKEALFQVDRQRQNDMLIKALNDASLNICQTIQRSINELRIDMHTCFNNLSIQLTNQHNEKMEALGSINSSLVDLKGLAIKIDEAIVNGNSKLGEIVSSNIKQIASEQILNNALLEKISVDSTRLVNDVDYVINYKKPTYV